METNYKMVGRSVTKRILSKHIPWRNAPTPPPPPELEFPPEVDPSATAVHPLLDSPGEACVEEHNPKPSVASHRPAALSEDHRRISFDSAKMSRILCAEKASILFYIKHKRRALRIIID